MADGNNSGSSGHRALVESGDAFYKKKKSSSKKDSRPPKHQSSKPKAPRTPRDDELSASVQNLSINEHDNNARHPAHQASSPAGSLTHTANVPNGQTSTFSYSGYNEPALDYTNNSELTLETQDDATWSQTGPPSAQTPAMDYSQQAASYGQYDYAPDERTVQGYYESQAAGPWISGNYTSYPPASHPQYYPTDEAAPYQDETTSTATQVNTTPNEEVSYRVPRRPPIQDPGDAPLSPIPQSYTWRPPGYASPDEVGPESPRPPQAISLTFRNNYTVHGYKDVSSCPQAGNLISWRAVRALGHDGDMKRYAHGHERTVVTVLGECVAVASIALAWKDLVEFDDDGDAGVVVDKRGHSTFLVCRDLPGEDDVDVYLKPKVSTW
ncbi:hypothetical protein B0T26DRAFT_757248 [Lasiosphaeria miniovina]|uniref:Uncharacterized protein n=1 Tax=Lasiosphaeria miniovina TaxID=1954250 RepID=A0AA39ZUG0_9PEZI|nr:uncharacterized protein B0T26DRAFT_757248 [Lasiosphaeria miniovina]KAK0703735.1 hypothetical protein B0T26DRAFT_757248 [Lasiosphaeria miniovina]